MTETKRGVINSSEIRNKFPHLYKEFFSRCQIVVSSSDSLFWAGEYARFFGGLTIMQKLPTKTMVGLEILNERKFTFAESLYGYDPAQNQFNNVHFDYAKEIRIINFLKDFWPSIDPEGKVKGFKIHILSEAHCGGGLGTTGIVFSCLSSALMLLAGQITISEIEKWVLAPVDDLINSDNYENFRKVFRLGWRMTAISRDGNSSGATSFAALISSPYPIVYFSKNINAYLADPTIANPKTNLENCQVVQEIPFWGSKLEEIFPIRSPQPWPIDIGRAYSGTLINTENIFKSLTKLKVDIRQLTDTINKEIALQVKNKELNFQSLFDFDEKSGKFTYYIYLNILNLISVKILLGLKVLFTTGPNEESLREFFNVINQSHDFTHFLGHSTPLLDKVCQRFSSIIAKDNDLNLACAKIEGIGKGGHVLFIGPVGTISNKIINEAQVLSAETKKEIYLDWASWIDGFGESGLQVEQFLDAGQYSPFISPQSYRVTEYEQGIPKMKIIEPSELETALKQNDITLFETEHKIYIQGKILSSKEILSAKATIEILKKILSCPECQIDNKRIDDPSYGQNRYDLQSKIFIPLNKALHKIANKKLDFQIHGGIYDNYSASINIKSLTIAIIERVK